MSEQRTKIVLEGGREIEIETARLRSMVDELRKRNDAASESTNRAAQAMRSKQQALERATQAAGSLTRGLAGTTLSLGRLTGASQSSLLSILGVADAIGDVSMLSGAAASKLRTLAEAKAAAGAGAGKLSGGLLSTITTLGKFAPAGIAVAAAATAAAAAFSYCRKQTEELKGAVGKLNKEWLASAEHARAAATASEQFGVSIADVSGTFFADADVRADAVFKAIVGGTEQAREGFMRWEETVLSVGARLDEMPDTAVAAFREMIAKGLEGATGEVNERIPALLATIDEKLERVAEIEIPWDTVAAGAATFEGELRALDDQLFALGDLTDLTRTGQQQLGETFDAVSARAEELGISLDRELTEKMRDLEEQTARTNAALFETQAEAAERLSREMELLGVTIGEVGNVSGLSAKSAKELLDQITALADEAGSEGVGLSGDLSGAMDAIRERLEASVQVNAEIAEDFTERMSDAGVTAARSFGDAAVSQSDRLSQALTSMARAARGESQDGSGSRASSFSQAAAESGKSVAEQIATLEARASEVETEGRLWRDRIFQAGAQMANKDFVEGKFSEADALRAEADKLRRGGTESVAARARARAAQGAGGTESVLERQLARQAQAAERAVEETRAVGGAVASLARVLDSSLGPVPGMLGQVAAGTMEQVRILRGASDTAALPNAFAATAARRRASAGSIAALAGGGQSPGSSKFAQFISGST